MHSFEVIARRAESEWGKRRREGRKEEGIFPRPRCAAKFLPTFSSIDAERSDFVIFLNWRNLRGEREDFVEGFRWGKNRTRNRRDYSRYSWREWFLFRWLDSYLEWWRDFYSYLDFFPWFDNVFSLTNFILVEICWRLFEKKGNESELVFKEKKEEKIVESGGKIVRNREEVNNRYE